MKHWAALLGASYLACTGAARADEPAATVAAKFGALPAVQDISISPDGRKVAIIAPFGAMQVVLVADLVAGGAPKPIMRADRKQGRLTDCVWSTDIRLVCTAHGISNSAGLLLGFTRSFALNSDGSKQVQLSALDSLNALGVMQDGGTVIGWDVAGQPGTVLMTRQFVPERSTGTRLAQTGEGLGVEQIDTLSLHRLTVEHPLRDAVEYITDGHGAVRILGMQGSGPTGYEKGEVRYSYRTLGSRSWQPLATLRTDGQTETGFNPYAVDGTRNLVYGFDDKGGYRALYSFSLDGSLKKEVVLSRPDVDVDELIRIGRHARVVGASYATDRRVAEYFDPELKKLRAALGKALPGDLDIDFVDADQGERKLLLVASGDVAPGKYYAYEKATHHLEEVLPIRPELSGVTLAPMKAITYKAADGTAIPAYLTLPAGSTGKGLPAIVMPHGGPSSRDEWGFDWLVQFFAARGFAVIQPNYRGSSGYGSAWYQKNGFQSWRTAIGDVNDAGRWLVSQGIAAPGKLAIVGWSYGGYAALQSAVLDPDLFKAIVAVAPVTDLERLRSEASKYTSGRIVSGFIGEGPHVREGSPAQNAERIKAPVLLFHGDLDENVAVGESRLMKARLEAAHKTVIYEEFPGLDHQLEDSAARTKLLSESDAFLRKALGL
jgi:dienelactone hydrolase